MPGTWTNPRTWVDGETPTGAQFNTFIRDEFLYLKDSPTFDGNVSIAGNLSVANLEMTGDLTVADDLAVLGDLAVEGSTRLGSADLDVVDIKGTVVGAPLKTYTETRTTPAITGGTLAIDLALGTYFKVALDANCTLALNNVPPAGRAIGVTLIFTADGTQRVITWPAGVVWPSGIAPVMTSVNGKRDVFTLITEDGGTTWLGVVVGQNY